MSSVFVRRSPVVPRLLLAVGGRSATITASAAAVAVAAARHRAFSAFIDERSAAVTLSHAREVKEREAAAGRKFGPRYLQALVNVAIGHFQQGDYDLARKCAIYAHDMVVAVRGSRDTLVYFSATTAAQCCRARADELTKLVEERTETSNPDAKRAAAAWSDLDDGSAANTSDANGLNTHETSSLTGGRDYKTNKKRAVTFRSVEQYVSFLRGESAQFERIARRVLNLPDKYFMKSDEEHRRDNAQEEAGSSSDFEPAAKSTSTAPEDSTVGPTRADLAKTIHEARQQRRYDETARKRRLADAEEAYARIRGERKHGVRNSVILNPWVRRTKGQEIWKYLRVPR